ncbi:hypothetical protein F383_32452 [Gossypium arboreum]|uniref:Uncharacterized protein n=1 Tax=Gossypium arboreum TaxID=29729 RepID=A0A0B0PM44_GOSAR|nr:hypothetical protein F383_32452 [Gossypium arboreum]
MTNLISMYRQWSRFYHQPYLSEVAREQVKD